MPSPYARIHQHPYFVSLCLAVSRIKGRSDLYEMDMLLDVNVDIFPIAVGDKLVVCLARTLNVDGTPSSTSYDAVREESGGGVPRCRASAGHRLSPVLHDDLSSAE